MAKQPKKEGFSIKGFDAQAYKQTEAYVQAIDALYNQAIMEFAQIATQAKITQDKPFAFKDYPATQAKVQQIVNGLAAKMQAVINKGSRNQWLYACKKNDEFIASILNTSKINPKKLQKMQDRNLEALKTFQSRKVNGMDLSQRVWKYTGQLKTTMELGIDVAIGKGASAAALSRELRKYLKEPDNLFRKVKDKHGNLVLSKAAKAFHPGQGVYRSSYKNAMRLTRSEINLAYKEADQLRWQQLDFVVGYEIKLSNNHTLNGEPFVDICDKLAGRYPKSFRFKGWHPQCRCLVVPILQDREEFNDDELADLKSALNGKEYQKYASKNTVTDVPDSFKEWIQENAERSQNWKSQPYFVRDNFVNGNISGGLKLAQMAQKPTQQARMTKVEPVKPVEKVDLVSKKMPADLLPDANYLKGKKIVFKKEFFDLIDENKPIAIEIVSRSKGSHYHPLYKKVHIADNSRNKASDWHRESVVYHEYGHAIDAQRGLRASAEVSDLMHKYRIKLNERITYKEWKMEWDSDRGQMVRISSNTNGPKIAAVSSRLDNIAIKVRSISEATFKKRGISKADVVEQIGATQDAIKAININYGWGHSTAYFRRPGMKETEFLAHCFENAFVGNTVFKKYLPDLYEDMIKYIRSLK